MSLPRIFTIALLSTLAALPSPAAVSNGPAAMVNGKLILKSEVADAIAAQRQIIFMEFRNDPARGQRELAELEEKALDQLIDRQLVLEEFKKIGGSIKPQFIDDDVNNLIREQFKGDRDAFINELARSGMTLKKFRDLREKMIIMQLMRAKHGGHQTPPTPREVQDYYEKHQDRWRDKDMLKISTITIPRFSSDPNATPEKQKELAQEIRSKIVAGTDFATMAKTYSQDSRAEKGGEWDWMERKQMKPNMADAAMSLKQGTVSPVLEEPTAFIIIYLDAKKPGDVTPLDEVRPEVEKLISAERGKGDVEKWLDGLRRKAIIRKY